jgi:hypothetical protein
MSNLSIIERLEQRLSAYAAGEGSRDAFVEFLSSSIRALENVPTSVCLQLREHEKAIEIEGYLDEEGFEAQADAAQERLRACLRELKEMYCAE